MLGGRCRLRGAMGEFFFFSGFCTVLSGFTGFFFGLFWSIWGGCMGWICPSDVGCIIDVWLRRGMIPPPGDTRRSKHERHASR